MDKPFITLSYNENGHDELVLMTPSLALLLTPLQSLFTRDYEHRLVELLKSRLIESGWRDDLKAYTKGTYYFSLQPFATRNYKQVRDKAPIDAGHIDD